MNEDLCHNCYALPSPIPSYVLVFRMVVSSHSCLDHIDFCKEHAASYPCILVSGSEHGPAKHGEGCSGVCMTQVQHENAVAPVVAPDSFDMMADVHCGAL